MPDYESIRIFPKTKSAISKLTEKFGMKQVDLLDAAMEYFNKTGLDPRDPVILSPADELNKFRTTIISFMRKQEKDYIMPVFGKMDSLIVRFMKYLEEEAPKRQSTTEIKTFMENKEGPIGEFSIPNLNVRPDKQPDNLGYENIKNELEREKSKLKIMKDYFDKVLSSVENKSTGLQKKPVIELAMSEIEDMRKYLKRC